MPGRGDEARKVVAGLEVRGLLRDCAGRRLQWMAARMLEYSGKARDVLLDSEMQVWRLRDVREVERIARKGALHLIFPGMVVQSWKEGGDWFFALASGGSGRRW